MTGAENTTSKAIGDVEVESAWPEAWLIVTVGVDGGAAIWKVIELSNEVDAALPRCGSATAVVAFAGIDTVSLPFWVIPEIVICCCVLSIGSVPVKCGSNGAPGTWLAPTSLDV